MITCEIDKIEGRKIFLKAKIVDTEGIIHTESTAIFVKVNWGLEQWNLVRNKLAEEL